MTKQYWLVKSEPDVYSFEDLKRDGRTVWDHVRNFQARNNLRAMKVGDELLYYHSQTDKAVVGIAKVVREAYPEVTEDEGDWSAVDVAPLRALETPVTLATIKAHPLLKTMALVRQSRLSVMPVTKEEFGAVVKLGK